MEKEAHSSGAGRNISLVTPARGARSPLSPLSPHPRSPRSRSCAKMGKKTLGKRSWEEGQGVSVQGVRGGAAAAALWGCFVDFFLFVLPVLPPVPSSGFRRFFRKEKNPPEAMEMQKSLGLGWGSRGRCCVGCLNSAPPRPPSPFPLYLSSAFPSLFIPERPPPWPRIPWKCGDGGLEVAPGCPSQKTGGKFLFC